VNKKIPPPIAPLIVFPSAGVRAVSTVAAFAVFFPLALFETLPHCSAAPVVQISDGVEKIESFLIPLGPSAADI